jgi:hypothetical protein
MSCIAAALKQNFHCNLHWPEFSLLYIILYLICIYICTGSVRKQPSVEGPISQPAETSLPSGFAAEVSKLYLLPV